MVLPLFLMYIETMNRREMTETQLREAIKRLEAELEKGEGTFRR